VPTPNPNGNPDSFFINWIRRKLRDQPAGFAQTIPTTGTDGVLIVAGAKPYRTQRAPILIGSVVLSAPSPANAGITGYGAVYSTVGVAPPAPVVADGGAGGALAAGTYQMFWTYVYAAGEGPPSPLSNAVTIVANHLLQTQAIVGLVPVTAIGIRTYLLPTSAAASVGGYLGFQDPLNPPTGYGGRSFNAAGNGILAVLINPDTGEIIFPAAPAAGNLSITYQATRFADQQVLDALKDGMQAMYPTIWQLAFDTSLIPSPVFYEYTLPAVFADMRVTLQNVELRVPNITVIPYKRYKRWSRPNPLTLAFMDRFSPAGTIRLSYNAPYSTLSDVDPVAMHLPCYYAMSLLLKEQEAMRTRATEMVPVTGEGGSKSGDATATSRDWKDLFDAELDRLGRPSPNRPDPQQVYEILA
jgi:hypothetical protein